MTKEKRVLLSVAVIGAVVVIAVAASVLFRKSDRIKEREVQGKITFLDVGARRASIEVIDPQSGAAEEFSGEVPADCEITINGRPATLADLRVDDLAKVRGRVEKGARDADGRREKHVKALWIQVERESGPPS